MVCKLNRALERPVDSPRERLSRSQRRDLEQNGKLVAEPRVRIEFTDAAFQPLAKGDEQRVTDVMTERIVDDLKAVKV